MVDLLGTVRFSQAQAFRSSRACQHLKQTVRLFPANARQKASRRGTTVSVQSLFGWGNSQVVENDFGVEYDGRVTVAKLQVGLSGSAREIQTDLEHLAAHADTDTPEGLHAVLQETVLALMRNPEYCLYAYSTGAALGDPDRAEQRFNQYSVEERSKFKTETRVNVDGMSRRGELQKSAVGLGGPEELIVVTILVAADGAFKLPKITSRNELRTALSRLGSLVPDDVMAVEVLWTPEEEGDYFTVEDLAMDYPLLNTL